MADVIESGSEWGASDPRAYAGVGAGPLRPGERVTLTDAKGRKHSVLFTPTTTCSGDPRVSWCTPTAAPPTLRCVRCSPT